MCAFLTSSVKIKWIFGPWERICVKHANSDRWQNIFATTRLWIYYVKATAWAVPPSAFLFYNLNLKACTGKMQYWKLKRHPSLSIRSTKRTLPVKNSHKLLTFLSLPLFWQGCLLCITITRASATNRPWLRGLIFTHHSPISLCKCFLQD